MRFALFTVAASLAALSLTGCGTKEEVADPAAPLNAKTAAVQDSTAAESGMGLTLDAANDALVKHATVSDPVTMGKRSVGTWEGGMDKLDLRSTASVDLTVQLEQVKNAAGQRKYPHLTGTLIIHAEGEVIDSWPTASNTMATHDVSVTFQDVRYTDPRSGAVARIASGTYTYALEAIYSYTSEQNWTLELDAKQAIAVGTPLVWTISRPHHGVRSVTLHGARDAHLDLARTNTTGTGGSTNRLVIDGRIDGTNADGATIDGVVGVDPLNPTNSFTNWNFLINGTDTVVWNRRANLRLQFDFESDGSVAVGLSGQEKIYITHNGTKHGPFTKDQLRNEFSCSLDD